MDSETSFFAELESAGYWRLQSNNPELIRKLRRRSSGANSPWSIVLTPGLRNSPWLFRRRFSDASKARHSFERILMSLSSEPFELVPVTVGKGWEVKRPPTAKGSRKMRPRPSLKELSNSKGGQQL